MVSKSLQEKFWRNGLLVCRAFIFVRSGVVRVPLPRRPFIMARWFRSEFMEYISLIVNEDAAHDCLADLGKLGVIQFTDPMLAAFRRAPGPRWTTLHLAPVIGRCWLL
eukprot:scaffold43995_cov54-Attheya_sp.AAC.1